MTGNVPSSGAGSIRYEILIRRSHATDDPLILTILDEAKLPSESVGKNVTRFYLGEQDGEVIGIGGLEAYGDDALIRSLAVRPPFRSSGVGTAIVAHLEAEARAMGSRRVVLLTETAGDFFARMGYSPLQRSLVNNEALLRSSEFLTLCPSTALCMVKSLQ